MLSEPSSPTLLTHRKREAILQAAISEFRAHGFAGTSMDRVAAVAEVSKRTVYNHFPSKDELFAAILTQLWQRAQAMVARLAEKEEGLVTWIRAAQLDQRLRADVDPQYAADQLQGMVKSFAFWPQLALGQPPLEAVQQQRVLADCVDMFLGFYAAGA